jgi:hypothetical protein
MRPALIVLCFTVLLGATALLGAPALPSADAKPPAIGVGEQKWEMFHDKRWKRLRLRHARYVTPWDTIKDPLSLQRLDAWIEAAREARVKPLIGFVHSVRTPRLAKKLPSRRQFRRQFKRLQERYPHVRNWIPWNEANHPGSLTDNRPGRAAKYFDVISSACRRCKVVAADVLDISTMEKWVRRFLKRVKHKPRIWGLHNYGDANGMKTWGLEKLLSITRGKVWLTETGGLVLRRQYDGSRVTAVYRYSKRHAARSTRHVLRSSCMSRRVRRVYLYHWKAPWPVTNWDSAFVSPQGKVRPAYYVLKRWIKRGGCRTRKSYR